MYYLSPENGYAVRKHERLTTDGKVAASYSNGSFQLVPGTAITLPGRVTMTSLEKLGSHSYELLSTPAHTVDLSVVRVSTEPVPKERFVLDMKEVVPGATVIDAVTPELQREDGTVRTFIMPASPEDVDEAIARAAGEYEGPGRSNVARNLLRYSCRTPGSSLHPCRLLSYLLCQKEGDRALSGRNGPWHICRGRQGETGQPLVSVLGHHHPCLSCHHERATHRFPSRAVGSSGPTARGRKSRPSKSERAPDVPHISSSPRRPIATRSALPGIGRSIQARLEDETVRGTIMAVRK